ncbi:MAG: hypothetical protein KKA12_13475 [Alphaproteobacteria bacterium]|nr:hypothetical protein [Alphaproteobacteria bacterium]
MDELLDQFLAAVVVTTAATIVTAAATTIAATAATVVVAAATPTATRFARFAASRRGSSGFRGSRNGGNSLGSDASAFNVGFISHR